MPLLRNSNPTLSMLPSFKYYEIDSEGEKKNAKDSPSQTSTPRDTKKCCPKVTWASLPIPPSSSPSSEEVTKEPTTKAKGKKETRSKKRQATKKNEKKNLLGTLTSFAHKLLRPFFPQHHRHPPPPPPPNTPPNPYTSCPESCKCHDSEREKQRGVVKSYPNVSGTRSMRLRDRDERGREIVERGRASWERQEWGVGRGEWLMGLQRREGDGGRDV